MAIVPQTQSSLPSRPQRQHTPEQESRATFIKLGLAGVVGGAIGLTYIVAAIAYLFPSGKNALGRTETLSLAGYPFTSGVAGPITYDFSSKGDVVGIFVVKDGSQTYGIEQTCTHLGCPVAWDPSSTQFQCPCHGSIFDKKGNVIHGPAPQPLYQHNVTLNTAANTVTVGGRNG